MFIGNRRADASTRKKAEEKYMWEQIIGSISTAHRTDGHFGALQYKGHLSRAP